jgi:hypothetical protein
MSETQLQTATALHRLGQSKCIEISPTAGVTLWIIPPHWAIPGVFLKVAGDTKAQFPFTVDGIAHGLKRLDVYMWDFKEEEKENQS